MFIAKYITGYNQLYERKLYTKTYDYTEKLAKEYAKLTGYPLFELVQIAAESRTPKAGSK